MGSESGSRSAPPQIGTRSNFWVRSGLLAAFAISLISMWPQMGLWIQRGGEWNGAFSVAYFDELIYASYVNGLIEGRPLRSDPLIESQLGETQPESLFSIQFVQPLLLSEFGRVFGLGADTVFIILTPIAAFLTSLSLFYLLQLLTCDPRLATAGSFFVLCFGTLAGWCGKLISLLHIGGYVSGFLFLRRYQPGLTLAFFFAFVLLIWIALTRSGKRGASASVFAGLFFTLLVFSYFYMWTAAAGWLFILILLWMFFRPEGWKSALIRTLPVIAIGAIGLLIYARALATIIETSYRVQAFEYTHAPDLMRFPLVISLAAILTIWLSVKKRRVNWRDPLTMFTLSFAILPFLLFNQQVVTGRSLQPFHYEWFNGNYVALIALLLAIFAIYRGSELLNQPRGRRAFLILGLVSICMGIIEINYDERKRRNGGRDRDEFALVAHRLRREEPTRGQVRYDREVVFSSNIPIAADNLTSMAPQSVLWASHTPLMPSLSSEEIKHRFFLYLYFCGVGPENLYKGITDKSLNGISALFGFERAVPSLSVGFKPPTDDEIRAEVSHYGKFLDNIHKSQVYAPVLSWAVIKADRPIDLSNLDKWYLRESEEVIGPYILIRLRPRDEEIIN
jgi:hypothetical protein